MSHVCIVPLSVQGFQFLRFALYLLLLLSLFFVWGICAWWPVFESTWEPGKISLVISNLAVVVLNHYRFHWLSLLALSYARLQSHTEILSYLLLSPRSHISVFLYWIYPMIPEAVLLLFCNIKQCWSAGLLYWKKESRVLRGSLFCLKLARLSCVSLPWVIHWDNIRRVFFFSFL